MLVSPYRPGGVPRYLAGRESELRALRDFIAPTLAYGQKADAQMVLHGPRGVGKTSLMKTAAAAAEEDGMIVAWTSCHRGQPFLADIARSIDSALTKVDAARPPDWPMRVERVTAELKVPALAGLRAELGRTRRAAPPAGVVSALEDLLRDGATRAAGQRTHRAGAGLLIAIDEVHAADIAELAILLNASQNLNDATGVPLAIVASGLSSARGLFTRAATFGERTRWLRVTSLDRDELREAVVHPGRTLGVEWDDEAVDQVLDSAQGYPHFAQVMANATWNEARPDVGDRVTASHAGAGLLRGHQEVLDLYHARWDSLSPKEQEIVSTIAETGTASGARRSAVEQVIGYDISSYRARLLDRDVLEDAERGVLQFSLPGFAEFVLEQSAR